MWQRQLASSGGQSQGGIEPVDNFGRLSSSLDEEEQLAREELSSEKGLLISKFRKSLVPKEP